MYMLYVIYLYLNTYTNIYTCGEREREIYIYEFYFGASISKDLFRAALSARVGIKFGAN